MLWLLIRSGYSLEAPHRGASNEYPQHMFLWRNKKNIVWTSPPICSYESVHICQFQAKKYFRAYTKCADSHHPAHARSHSGCCSPLIHSMVSNDSGSGHWRPWSDSTSLHSDLGLCCLHFRLVWLNLVRAYIIWTPTVLSTSLGKMFFAWRFILNENILFWWTISYQ